VLQFTGALADIIFVGEGEAGALSPTVDFNGKAITCTFINLKITDTTGSNLVSASEFWDCNILKVIAHTVGGANYHHCRFAAPVTNPPLGIINCYDECISLGNFTNTTGTINVTGSCLIIGILSNTTGTINVTGSCLIGGDLTNTTGTIYIEGNCHVGGDMTNTTGNIYITGNYQSPGGISQTDVGNIGIDGDCRITGDLSNTTGDIIISGNCHVSGHVNQTGAGTMTIDGNLEGGFDLHNTTGTTVIYGDCHLAGDMTNTTGGVTVHGDCHVQNIDQNNTGTITIDGNCQVSDTLSNTTGTLNISGNCQISGDLSNTTGDIAIYGDCLVGGNLTNTTGHIFIDGDCQIAGALANQHSLQYGTIKFTAPNPTLDLGLSATSVTERIVSRGSLTVARMVAGATAIIDLSGGTLTIAATCTGGTIDLYGDCDIVIVPGGVVTINDRRRNQQNTRFFQETVAATDVDGTNWKDLLDRSVITKPVRICGFMVTKGAGWAGFAQIRIVDGAGLVKLFPFQAQYVEPGDFASAALAVFNFPVEVSVSKGYKFQFRSSNAADGAGETLALDNLDVQELS